MTTPVSQGQVIAAELVGPLNDSMQHAGNEEQLAENFCRDGYVYLKNFFPTEDVMAARRDIFTRLASVGEIAEPPTDGIFTGRSNRPVSVAERGQFWRSVSETWALRRLSHGRRLHTVMDYLLAEESRVQDYLFLRPAGPGKHTNLHCDAPFFTRTTEKVTTAWIALGDIPVSMGPLFIVENSHTYRDIREKFRNHDYSPDDPNPASLSENAVEFATQRNTRLLTTDFNAGDIIIFGMYLVHGALDNISSNNEVRLSCDVRYQAASAEIDPRYFSADPSGTTGAGYGELVGSKAMTEEWHQR